MEYTLEDFLENYKRDRKVFGSATKSIYENFFGCIVGDSVIINESAIYDDTIYEGFLTEEEIEEEIFTEGLFGWFRKKNPMIDGMEAELKAAQATEKNLKRQLREVNNAYNAERATAIEVERARKRLNKAMKESEEAKQAVSALTNIDKTVANSNMLNPKSLGVDAITGKGMSEPLAVISNPETAVKPLGFFGRLKEKIASIFSGESTIGSLLKQGFAWLTNPANLSKVVLTGGGIATIVILLNALKRRKKMKQYKALQSNAIKALEDKQEKEVKESCLVYDNCLLESLQKNFDGIYFNY